MEKKYTPKQMAELLNVTVRTLQRWDKKGVLEAYRTPTDRRYYTHEQYLNYVNNSELGMRKQEVTFFVKKNSVKKIGDVEKKMDQTTINVENELLVVELNVEQLTRLANNRSDRERYIMSLKGSEMKKNIPLKANPRVAENNSVYKDIKTSYINEQDLFVAMNGGIVIVASKIEKINEKTLRLYFLEDEGIANGGHTTKAIIDTDEYSNALVDVKILIGYDQEEKIKITRALNTSTKIKDTTMMNYAKEFDIFKEEWEEFGFNQFIWTFEGDSITKFVNGVPKIIKKPVKVDDILAYLYGMSEDIKTSDNDVTANSSIAKVKEAFRKNPERFYKFKPIINDILILIDHVKHTAKNLYGRGSSNNNLFPEGNTKLHFIDAETDYKVTEGVFRPLICSFGAFLEENEDGFVWANEMKLEDLKEIWAEHGKKLLDLARMHLNDKAGSITELGKSQLYWRYTRQEMREVKRIILSGE